MNYYVVAPYVIAGISASTVDECIEYLSTKSRWAIDVETSPKPEWKMRDDAGLDPYLANVTMLQLGDEHSAWAIDMRYINTDELNKLIEFMRNPYYRKIGHNLKFDLKMLRPLTGFFLENIYDTMVAEMILMCGLQKRGFSLERLSKKYLGFSYASSNQLDLFAAPDAIHLTKATRQSFRHVQDKPFTKEQVVYGLKDIEHTIRIYNHQLEKLAEQDLLSTCWLEFMTTVALAEMEFFGFYLDAEAWTKLAQKHELKKQEALAAILSCIANEPLPDQFYEFQRSLFERTDTSDKGISINLSSSRQVIELCKALGIPTKTKDLKKSRELGEDVFKDSVEEKILKEHKSVHPVVPLYLTYKKYEKAVTTYGTRFIEEHKNPVTGCIHSNYWQILNTGRLASQRPNQQNITRNGDEKKGQLTGFRNCFTPRSESTVLITADYSSQEIRILADKTGDAHMIAFLNSDDPDFHSFTARRMFNIEPGKPVPSDLRTVAKTLGFGMQTNAELKERKFGETLTGNADGNPEPSPLLREGVETWLISIKTNSPCVK